MVDSGQVPRQLVVIGSWAAFAASRCSRLQDAGFERFKLGV
jgi:hypothetical protein